MTVVAFMLDKSPQQNMEFAAVAVRTLKAHIRQLHNFMFDKSRQPINLSAVVLQTSSPANKTADRFMFDKSLQPNEIFRCRFADIYNSK